MSRQPRSQGSAAPMAARQNEYFVPRDGIDREVITADICRYLGNDALVRPGPYEDPQTGRVVQGYYINAYRNLTSAMIDDLKADSARWENERRAQTSRSSSGVQYHQSETHQSRQDRGPSDPHAFQDPYGSREPAFDTSRYPGSNAPGYNTGSHSSYTQQPSGYGTQPSGWPGYSQGVPQQSSQMQGFPGPQDSSPYVSVGTNRGVSESYGARGHQQSVAPPPQPLYAAVQPPQAGYTSYHQSQLPPQSMSPDYYGRVSPAGPNQQAPPSAFSQATQQQYDEPPPSRASVSSSLAKAQTPPTGSSNRRSDRDSDRHSSDRHHRSSRR